MLLIKGKARLHAQSYHGGGVRKYFPLPRPCANAENDPK
jgi:hypothetical protein